MVYLKELHEKSSVFLSLVEREEDAAEFGTRLITRQSLRHLKGESIMVDKKSFLNEMSAKLDSAQPDTYERHVLKSTFPTRSDQHPNFPLLGRHIISGQVKWGSNHLRIYGEAVHISGYWEWTEDILARFGDTLTTASIYTAVYASLYSYDKDLHIMRAFFESWCDKTNTLHTREGELSISLWDLQKLGGLPIDGEIYDETVPQLDMLRERDSKGNKRIPETCKFLLGAFRRLLKRSKSEKTVSSKQWIDFWCKRPLVHEPPPRIRRKTVNAPKFTHSSH